MMYWKLKRPCGERLLKLLPTKREASLGRLGPVLCRYGAPHRVQPP
jgi:hypothetical protein